MDNLLKAPKVDLARGKPKHNSAVQILRGVALFLYFLSGCVAIVITQLLGSPLYWIHRPIYDAYIAVTKQSFALLAITTTQWWGPTTMRISGDESVAGQISQLGDGRVAFDFPERIVLMANHQIYTDWLYLWWIGYANLRSMHGHVYIILKESLSKVPILGIGMRLYRFIFMSRKMAIDEPRMKYRLNKLMKEKKGLNGQMERDPMWLLLFPEGTNMSPNSRPRSDKWAEKIGVDKMEHVLLPRSTGIYFCLKELGGSVEYLYDCTVAYEGVPRGGYGEDYYTLTSTYLQGLPPPSVNLHWRRFATSSIPLETVEQFDEWLRARWTEKDALMEEYLTTGRFPPLPDDKKGYIETSVRTKYWFEFMGVYNVLGGLMSLFLWPRVLKTLFRR